MTSSSSLPKLSVIKGLMANIDNAGTFYQLYWLSCLPVIAICKMATAYLLHSINRKKKRTGNLFYSLGHKDSKSIKCYPNVLKSIFKYLYLNYKNDFVA